LASKKLLPAGGKIWLPNLDCIQEQLDDNKVLLAPYFDIKLVKDSKTNPLYRATDNVEEELLRCPDILTNETQIRPLLDHSDHPFYVLEVKSNNTSTEESSVHIVTPTPTRSRNPAVKKEVVPIVRGRRAPKRGYVSDSTSESEPSTPIKRPTRRTNKQQ
jgi:hypothetical protein